MENKNAPKQYCHKSEGKLFQPKTYTWTNYQSSVGQREELQEASFKYLFSMHTSRIIKECTLQNEEANQEKEYIK